MHLKADHHVGDPNPGQPAERLQPTLVRIPLSKKLLTPCVTFRLVVGPLRGPGRSPVLPFACCVGSLLFCRPPRPVLLLVSFPRSRSPVVGVLGLC